MRRVPRVDVGFTRTREGHAPMTDAVDDLPATPTEPPRRSRRWWWGIAVALSAVVVFVVVWFQPQKLFIDERVDEAIPTAAVPSTTEVDAPPATSPTTDPPAAGRARRARPRRVHLPGPRHERDRPRPRAGRRSSHRSPRGPRHLQRSRPLRVPVHEPRRRRRGRVRRRLPEPRPAQGQPRRPELRPSGRRRPARLCDAWCSGATGSTPPSGRRTWWPA